MDAPVDRRHRNSRWTRDPVIDDGDAVVVRPTERDIEIFKLLTRYRYLPSDYIHAFVGGNSKALGRRLNSLSRKPNLYLARPHQQRTNADANHRPLIYELDGRGSRLLRERGVSFISSTHHGNFAHELMVAQIMASIELGVKENPNIRLISWPEILASANTPEATRNSRTPASIPVSYSMRGPHAVNLTADAHPFGLERLIAGTRTYLFFPGIEADCSTEPLDPNDHERSSIARKFAAYTAVAQQGMHRSHFGFPNFLVPIIAPTKTRMQSMMRLLETMTEGRGSKMFLFKTFPGFASAERPREPGGHMLTEPWHRAGFPALHLDR
jgi:protein involved in plasmid replication-relaxation